MGPTSSRWLGVASRAAVLGWIVALLAYAGRSQDPPAPAHPEPAARAAPREGRARIALQPAPPRRPADPVAAPQPADPADPAAGEALLASRGTFPALSIGYDRFPSFRAYARAMAELGARFAVVRRRRVVAAADLESGALSERVDDLLAGKFSPRARDYTGEPALFELASAARRRFGGDADVVMLVPRRLDAALFGGIARALARRGDHHDRYREIRGRYEPAPEGGLRLRVESGLRADGARVPLDLHFELGA